MSSHWFTALGLGRTKSRGARAGATALVLCALPLTSGHAQWLSPPSLRVALHQMQPATPHKVRLAPEPTKPSGHALKGPLQIIISVAKQRLALYDDGELLARAAVSTGMPGHRTPLGVFSILSKHRWHRSNLYSNAPMPYMQRITWSGVALHAGVLPGYPASHGCIRLATNFAIRLWQLTKRGTRVIIARDELVPIDISSPHLFAPKARRATANAGVEMLKTAAAAGPTVGVSSTVDDAHAAPAPAPRGPAAAISILVSRKEGKLFVRQNYTPILESAVTIEHPEQPLGTHVFTAMELQNDGAAMRWTVVSMRDEIGQRSSASKQADKHPAKKSRANSSAEPGSEPPSSTAAAAALERIKIPNEVVERISELLTPGSSLIIADGGVSEETGSDTDFIVLTH